MKDMLKKIRKSKFFPLYIIILIVIIICIISIKNFLFPSDSTTNYGNRLDSIKNVPFNKNSQSKIVEKLDSMDKLSNTKVNVHGKIINIIFNVEEDISMDDAKKVASESLNAISSKVKKLYDIQVLITKSNEKGEEKDVTDSDGNVTKETVKEFPVIGYKNSNEKDFVW